MDLAANSYETTGPVDLHAERAVLGAALVSPDALSRLLAELEPRDFYRDSHRHLFAAIRQAAREHETIDHVVVSRYIPANAIVTSGDERDARALAFEIMESVPSALNAAAYATSVKQTARARRLMDVAERIKQDAASSGYAGAPERAATMLEEVIRATDSDPAKVLMDGMDDLAQWLADSRESGGITGIRTGIPKLDFALKGLNPKRLYVLAGRPGMGKSLVIGQIVLTAARNEQRVLLQSPEMGVNEYLRRLATASADVHGEKVEAGDLTDAEHRQIFDEAAKMTALPIFVDDRGTQTVADIRRNVTRYQPDLLVVDYLQRLMPEDRKVSRYEQVSQISYDLDRIKKDFGIPVLTAAQLSRAVEQRADKHPMLSDLRDSGTVEQDADAVVMLYRPHFYDESQPADELEFHVEKNRHGPVRAGVQYVRGGLWVVGSRVEAKA